MLSAALFILLLPQSAATQSEPHLTVDPQDIAAGSGIQLSWECPLASRAYLTTVGILNTPLHGSITVAPTETTTYVLLVERPGKLERIVSQTVVVHGGKGSQGDWPDPFSSSDPENRYPISGVSLVDVAAKIQSVLQQKFAVRQFSQSDELIFQTSFSERSTLSKRREAPRRIRRIAFRVAISRIGPKAVQLNIGAAIQWRSVIDRRWFPENLSSTDLYQTEIEALKKDLGL